MKSEFCDPPPPEIVEPLFSGKEDRPLSSSDDTLMLTRVLSLPSILSLFLSFFFRSHFRAEDKQTALVASHLHLIT